MKQTEITEPVVPEKPRMWGGLTFTAMLDVLSYLLVIVMLCAIFCFGALEFQKHQSKISMLEEQVKALQAVQSGADE